MDCNSVNEIRAASCPPQATATRNNSPEACGFEVANGPSEVCAGPALGAGVRTCSGWRVAWVTDCGSSASLQPQPVTGAPRFGLAEDETAVRHSSLPPKCC
jgi:hypothetical protein